MNTPPIPQWLVELVPPETLRDATTLAVDAAALVAQLTLAATQIKELVELCDDVILLRLAKAGQPVTRDGVKAITTEAGIDIVHEVFAVFADPLMPAYGVIDLLEDYLQRCERGGIHWRSDSNDPRYLDE